MHKKKVKMAGRIDSLAECNICFEFMENPKILPCHHSFCGECVEKLKQRDSIKCPMDNKIFNFDDVQYDFRLGQIMEALQKKIKAKVR